MNLHGAATAALFTGAVAACAFLVQQFLGPFNFHSAEFGIFLVLAVGLYWTLADRRSPRNLFLLGASVVFYASYTWWYLGLILFSTLLDYRCGRVIAHSPVQRHRLLALLASLGGNLGLLGFFKYYDWGVESLQLGLAAVGVEVDPWLLNQAVPVGISFYTFQTLSYTIDIYRGVLQPARNLREFALFVCFFPSSSPARSCARGSSCRSSSSSRASAAPGSTTASTAWASAWPRRCSWRTCCASTWSTRSTRAPTSTRR